MKKINKFTDLLPLSKWLTENNSKKSLGQNFLLNLNITDKISSLAKLEDNSVVLEIGPGLGPLTISILNTYSNLKTLYVIEKDFRLKTHLERIQNIDNRIKIIMGDCLNVMIPIDVEHIVANLPYNISVPFILKSIENKNIKTMTLLVQKEVAERFVSKNNNKTYGKISILAQIFMNVKIIYYLGPEAFTPPPKVHSALLYFIRKEDSNENLLLWPIIEDILAISFQHRRKLLSNTLGKKYNILKPYIENKRCENLTTIDILNFAKIIYNNLEL